MASKTFGEWYDEYAQRKPYDMQFTKDDLMKAWTASHFQSWNEAAVIYKGQRDAAQNDLEALLGWIVTQKSIDGVKEATDYIIATRKKKVPAP